MSTGPGRLYFYDLAAALQAGGEEVQLVTGWVPRATKSAAHWLSAITGNPALVNRLAARCPPEGIRADGVRTCPVADLMTITLERLGRYGLLPAPQSRAWAWRNYGHSSRKHLRRHHADLFHVRSGAGRGAIDFARSLGMKVIVDHSLVHPATLRATLAPEENAILGHSPTVNDEPFQALQLADCEESDCVLVNSMYVRDSFLAAGFDPRRLEVAYLGIADHFIGVKRSWKTSQPFKLLFTGVFGIRKGAHYLLECLRLLTSRGFAFECTVIGPHEPEIHQIVRTFDIRTLRLIPWIPQAHLKAYLCSSDAYIFPTLAEGCAQSAMEAMGAGLPVITTPACGLPTGDREGALLVPTGDPKALADAVEELAADHALRNQIGEHGTALIASGFRWHNAARRVMQIHAQVLT